LVGEEGLRKRHAYTDQISGLTANTTEPSWTKTFHRWREAWRRTRQDQLSGPRVPDEAEADLLAVRRPGSSIVWVLHDRSNHLAAEVSVDETTLSSELAKKVHRLADRYSKTEAISISVAESVSYTTPHNSDWMEEYHLVPLTGVMVDGNDRPRLLTPRRSDSTAPQA
jgi:hypothetical protein